MVDAHTHVVPARLSADTARDPRWPSVELSGDKAAVMIDGKVFRRIDSRSWDVRRRLADIDEDGTAMQVLSPMPELLSHWLPPNDAEYLAETINECIAGMVGEAPRRFAGIGMACVQDVPRALAQLQRIKALGLAGIEIGSHVDGIALGSEVLHPLYEVAEALDLCIFVHPLHPAGLERIGAGPEFAATTAFPLETALAAVSLLAGGVLEKFPKLRILLSHGGGALPWILPRLDYGWSLGGEMQKRMTRPPREIARGFFYDSIVYDGPALQFMSSAVGSNRIVVGSDYPFAIRQKDPGTFTRAALPDCPGILADNAFAFLGPVFDVEIQHAANSDRHSVAPQQA
ncbi:amidohydrolase family protein [Bradyrhizobium sp. BRP22]|uniref:amidohydrolase family protein n=1 Tax=Bradyrhizobium sp. BRP22 TaxID=2793821 RepID=UPI001CD73E32